MRWLKRLFSSSTSNLRWHAEGWSIAKSQDGENEDAYVIDDSGAELLVVLADGQGGRPGGARAARTAVQTIQQLLEAKKHDLSWMALGAEVDRAVSESEGAGFTTLLVVEIAAGRLRGISNGDCILVAGAPSGSSYCLNENQPKNPPVGSGSAAFSELNVALDADTGLVCATDGVWRPSGRPALATWAAERISAADAKLRWESTAKRDGFSDDATAVFIWPGPHQ